MLLMLLAVSTMDPGEQLQVFDDWIVGCANLPACHATSLDPETPVDRDDADIPFVADNEIRMAIRRDAGMHAKVQVQLLPNPFSSPETAADPAQVRMMLYRNAAGTIVETMRLSADDLVPLAANGTLAAESSAHVAQAVQSSETLELVDGTGATIATVSLRGGKEALRYMDFAQHRKGNVTALVEKGEEPAYRVPPYVPMQPVVVPPFSSRSPTKVASSDFAALVEKAKCPGENPPASELVSERLDDRTTLFMTVTACASYNNEGLIYTVADDGTARPAVIRPDRNRPPLEQPIVGAWWDTRERRLHSFGRGRGLSDCGTHQSYAWDGAQFLLVLEEAMSICRGSVDYITVYERPVVDAK